MITTSLYKGHIIGINPSVTNIFQNDYEISEYWSAYGVTLNYISERKIQVTLSYDGHTYKTTSCTWIKDDVFQLVLDCNDGTKAELYLYIFFNRSIGIVVQGTWTELGNSYDILGNFQQSK